MEGQMEIRNKVVAITGGSKGFGKSLAKAFTREGAIVIIGSEKEEALKNTALELDIDYFKLDVRNQDEIEGFANYVKSKHQRIDYWINNAGIQIAPSLAEDVDIDKLHNLYSINFFGSFYGCQTAIRHMKKQGTGTIININSTAGLEGKPNISAYSSSKFALKGLTESIRKELEGSEIKVLSVHPGGMQTEIYKEKYPDDFGDYMSVDYATEKVIDNLRLGEPELDLVIRRPSVEVRS